MLFYIHIMYKYIYKHRAVLCEMSSYYALLHNTVTMLFNLYTICFSSTHTLLYSFWHIQHQQHTSLYSFLNAKHINNQPLFPLPRSFLISLTSYIVQRKGTQTETNLYIPKTKQFSGYKPAKNS